MPVCLCAFLYIANGRRHRQFSLVIRFTGAPNDSARYSVAVLCPAACRRFPGYGPRPAPFDAIPWFVSVAFSAFFAAIDHLGGGHFFAQGQPDSTQTFQYFSFTTLATLGYGDFTAARNFGRALADLEALTGQIFLVTLVAFLVARFRAPGEQQR